MQPDEFEFLQGIGIDFYTVQPSMFVYAGGVYACPESCPPFNTNDAMLVEDCGSPETITCMQSPTSIPVPFTSEGGVDCTVYTQSAQTAWQNGDATPIIYVLGAQGADILPCR